MEHREINLNLNGNRRSSVTEFLTLDESTRRISPRQMFEKGFFREDSDINSTRDDHDFMNFDKHQKLSSFSTNRSYSSARDSKPYSSLFVKSQVKEEPLQNVYDLKPSFTTSITDRAKFDMLDDALDIEASLSSKIIDEEVKEDIDAIDHSCAFRDFQTWLFENGAEFPELYLKTYSQDVRGVHAKRFVDSYQTIVSIPLKCLITDHMGRTQTDLGRKVFNSNANLSTPNLIAVILYILTTRRDPQNFFQPYYRILPKSYSNFPIFWDVEKLGWLRGSPLLEDIEERKMSMRSDYDEVCRVCPEFGMFSFDEFLEVRTAVGSRNFGIVVNAEKRTAMVPFADMLNHYRPRETSWTYENAKGAFTITSISPLQPGQPVMDSYGKKCNSKFFLHYGFAVERNREEDGKCQNELLLKFNAASSVFKTINRSGEGDLVGSKIEEDLAEKKMTVLKHLFNVTVHGGFFISKSFRISMNFEDKGTSDAFAFLRIKAASEIELSTIVSQYRASPKHLPEIYFSRCKDVVVPPLNPENEANALEIMADFCRGQLAKYERSYDENLYLLNSGKLQPFSDMRTALIVILGEQEICEFWIYTARILGPILRSDGKLDMIRSLSSLPRSTDRERDLLRLAIYLADKFKS